MTKLLLLPLALLTFALTASPASASPIASAGQGWPGVQWTTSSAAKTDAPIQINAGPSCQMSVPLPGDVVYVYCEIPSGTAVQLHYTCTNEPQDHPSPIFRGPRIITAQGVCSSPGKIRTAWWNQV